MDGITTLRPSRVVGMKELQPGVLGVRTDTGEQLYVARSVLNNLEISYTKLSNKIWDFRTKNKSDLVFYVLENAKDFIVDCRTVIPPSGYKHASAMKG